MDTITTITAGISATKSLMDVLRGIKGMTDQSKITDAIIVAQDHILSLQQSLLETQAALDTLAKEKRELEAHVSESNEWKSVEDSYYLHELRSGLCVYRSNGSGKTVGTPTHWACPKCYAKREIQILHSLAAYHTTFKCPNCNFSADTDPNARPPRSIGNF